ncbi:MAG: serine acetyltransferase [Eubacteriaceae bacterium]|jgi:serine O-acetyltransferase|nr:serine acetyltransferase [Eubacteriaceae bacterium]
MKLNDFLKENSRTLSEELMKINEKQFKGENISGYGMKKKTIELIGNLMAAMFPTIYELEVTEDVYVLESINRNMIDATVKLFDILQRLLVNQCRNEKKQTCTQEECRQRAEEFTMEFMAKMPTIRGMLTLDIEAAYAGDPAARYIEEILLGYPSVQAVAIYRLAHEMFIRHIPIIPRVMTEYAHEITGIDIHPGATIGKYFFIDHGTGVVIGETCTIGDNVKLYQGVTLGAKSFEVDADGNLVKGIKRHPDIEDDVVIYSGATILGGDTRIGRGSIIGGNVWLTESVPPYSRVYNSTPSPIIKEKSNL